MCPASALYFATSNRSKFEEARPLFARAGIRVLRFPFRHTEIRSDSVEKIAREAVSAAFRQLRQPVFVEDTGLFISSLNGFPGTYSAWALGKIGNAGILRLLGTSRRRGAYFETCIALATSSRPDGIPTFSARCPGSIARKEQGKGGFGYDPIFVPKGSSKTFAQDPLFKARVSHRTKAMEKLLHHLKYSPPSLG